MDSSSVTPPMIDTDHRKKTSAGDEISTERHPKPKGGWNAAIFVIFVEMTERFAFYGLAANLITYLTNNLGEPTATAAKNVNTWVGVSSIFPLVGAFIADSYLGRFKTILLSSIVFFLGMVLLSLSVSVVPMEHRRAVFYTALYILAVGEGGHKPCVQTFAADQFDDDKAVKSSFFNWWYLGIVFGASSAVLVVIYLQDHVSWTVGFGVLAGALAVALVMFLMGIKRYRKQSPTGSPFTSLLQVFVAAARKWRVTETSSGRGICYQDQDCRGQCRSRNLVRTNQLRCLDKAMIIDDNDVSTKTRNPWRLCPLNQVEEVKLVLRLIPVWLGCLMYCAAIVQVHTFFIKQGSTMIRSIGPHFQVPPAALQSLIGFTILITVPIYDRIFIPMARKVTGGITILQRIGVGLFLSILMMVIAALVEAKRVSTAKEHGLIDTPKATVPMSVWWLLPQYMICGIADVFTIVGLQELFYDQVPEVMRSIGAAAYISVVGIGSFVNTAIITVVQMISARHGKPWLGNNLNRAHLDYFYWVLAGLSFVNLCVYVLMARCFVYKRVGGDDMKEEGKGLSLNSYLDEQIST
ncbi:hypothetical protein SLE2022_123570 [Rubroshorea leprosula]